MRDIDARFTAVCWVIFAHTLGWHAADEAAAALRDDGSGGGEETDEGLSRDHWYMSHLAAAQMTKDVLGNS